MKYSPVEIDKMLATMTVLVDTREQDTEAFRWRMENLKAPYRREKLDFGDYSCEYIDYNGVVVSLKNRVCVERKMSLDELAACFTRERKRFEREFERVKKSGATVYLLVENGSYEKILNHQYRSRLLPKAFMASLFAWQARYPVKVMFCRADTTPELLYDILRYELKIYLEVKDELAC